MSKEVDPFAYMMAAEKVCNMIYTLQSTMAFMEEYNIVPDENVIKALAPIIQDIRKWLGIK